MASICVETFAGTPKHEAYLKTSPRPEAWPTFVAKMRQLLGEDYYWTEAVASLKTPSLILVGDADSLRLAHAVECFALLGGGKADGDKAGLPPAQFGVLPATTHVGLAPPYHGSSLAPGCSFRSSRNSSIHLCQRPAEAEERCA
jgi:hypothetical protein